MCNQSLTDAGAPVKPAGRHKFTVQERRKGGLAAAAKLTHEQRAAGGKARASQPGFSRHQAERGRRGYRATMARYGLAAVLNKLADYRRRNPSGAERWVRTELEAIGLREGCDFQRECRMRLGGHEVLLDFMVSTWCGWLVIEPGAAFFHDQARDADRDAALAALGYRVLRFDAARIKADTNRLRAEIAAAVRGIYEEEVQI